MTATRECKHTFEVGSVNVAITATGELPDDIEKTLDLAMAHAFDRIGKIGVSMRQLRPDDDAMDHDEMVIREGSLEIGQFRVSCEVTCHLAFGLEGIAAKQRAEVILAPTVTNALAFISAAFDMSTTDMYNDAMIGLERQRLSTAMAGNGFGPEFGLGDLAECLGNIPGMTRVDLGSRPAGFG